MEKIRQIYEAKKITPSDINEHLETIYELSKECSHITEMGVRWVASTWPMLLTNPKKMISYDISYHNYDINQVIELAKEYNLNYEFVIADVLKTEIELTELLFIDTLHTYNQLTAELQLHASKASKYIILHDTEYFGRIDEGVYDFASEIAKNSIKTKEGLMTAVEDFLESEKGKDWEIFKVYKNNNGLTVLKHKDYTPQVMEKPKSILEEKKLTENNTNKWNSWYEQLPTDPSEFYYGNTVTYGKAANFLLDCKEVEDWGVGAGGFLRYRPDAIGVDGSTTPFAKKQNVDLKTYTSDCDCVNMRHVLEHNYSWEDILINMLKSAKRKIALVTFVPFSEGETKEVAHNLVHGVDVPDLSLSRERFMEIINSFNPKSVRSEKLQTATGYSSEEIFYIEL